MFGFDRTDVKTLPLDNVAQWQRGYDISTDAAQAAVCPPCSKRDVKANGAFISETNPYVLESHLGDGPDSPALLSTCNHPSGISGTPESLLPAAGVTELASSSGGGGSSSLSEDQFNLHSDIDVTGLQVAAAAPAPASVSNDGSYIYIDPLNNNNNNAVGSAGSSDASSYIDQFDSASAYRTPPPTENTTPIILEQANFAIQGRRKMRKRAE